MAMRGAFLRRTALALAALVFARPGATASRFPLETDAKYAEYRTR